MGGKMLGKSATVQFAASVVLVLLLVTSIGAVAQTPLTVAFIGDQNNGSGAVEVLNLIANEDASMVIHQGDFDYSNDPTDWDDRISGPNADDPQPKRGAWPLAVEARRNG